MSTINENTTINGTLTVSNGMTAKKDLHVRGWLYAANVANIYKGSFANTTELNARWPAASCEDGWVAGVGNQTNGLIAYVFNATAGAWQSTGAKLYVDINTEIEELQSGKADKISFPTNGNLVAMNANGNLTNSGKKATDFEDVSNKVTDFSDPTNTKYPSALLVYDFTREILGLSVNEAVRVTFHPENDYKQEVLYSGVMKYVKLIVMDGKNYTSNEIELIGGEDNVVSFVFNDPSTIPDNAFLNIENIAGVHIPSFVHAIGDKAFNINTVAPTLKNIECEGMTPPRLGTDAFPVSVTNVKVHDVVIEKYTDYEGSTWGGFAAGVFGIFS